MHTSFIGKCMTLALSYCLFNALHGCNLLKITVGARMAIFGSDWRFVAIMMVVLFSPCSQATGSYVDRYGLNRNSPAIDVGIQPLGVPSGVLSSVMRRDGILLAKLKGMGNPLLTYPFQRGADMLPALADGRLDAALLGDMPTLLAAAAGNVLIVGLVKQSPTAIVARGGSQVGALAGKRIAYVEASSAHQTLLQGLSSAGLSEKNVRLVPMRVDEMPAALARGEIEAFAAWEPAPSIALANSEANRIVFRGSSSDYFVVSREVAKRFPQAVNALVAAYVRAIEWLRLSLRNQEKAAQWVKDDAETFSGKKSDISLAQIAAITRRELLNIPSAPRIIVNPRAQPPLKNEFDFLKGLGKLPADASWANVESAMGNDILVNVLTDTRLFETGRFDYPE